MQIALENGRSTMVRALIDNPLKAAVCPAAPFWFVEGPLRDNVLFDVVFTASGAGIDDRSATGQTLVQLAMTGSKADMVKHFVVKHKSHPALCDVARPPGKFWPDGQTLPLDMLDALLTHDVNLFTPASVVPGVTWSAAVGSCGWFFMEALRGFTVVNGFRGSVKERSRPQVRGCMDRILARWNADADLFARTDEGAAALTDAAGVEEWSALKRLVEARAGLEARNQEGRTPLHVVAAKGSPEALSILEILLAAGANVLAFDRQGNTALRIAEQKGWADGAAVLCARAEAAAMRAALSGDGTVTNVGIKLDGEVHCAECKQRFDSEQARQTHWKFIHDPNRHQED